MIKIGEIPRRWETVKLGDGGACQIIMGQSPPSSTYNKIQEGLPFLQGNMEFGEIYPSPSIYCSEPAKIAEKNDVLISVRAPVGDVNISLSKVCIGRGLASIRCNSEKTSHLFLFYYLKYIGKTFESISAGSTFKAIRKNELDQLEIRLPPAPEQKKIAEILSTVDQAIEKVGEAIEKTQKLKKGLMQELLTKGIGQKEFKDTEIGKIPKDWKVARISDIADVKGGKRLPKGQKLVNSKTSYPYIRVLDFKDMGVDVSNIQFLLPETHKSIRQYIISSNDVYISIAGTVGIVGLIPLELDNANLTENAAKLCNLRDITKEFLAYVLSSSIGQSQISVYLGKAQQPKLALFRIQKIKLPLPSLTEQQKIAEILSTVDERLELLRNRKERLKRTKKGLMNDLLTGRKRVRKSIEEET
jgi:type I restriction enzyme S subunit